ncbi:MAG: preprotein translocase subunit SecG [Luteolibacter sp.]
MILASILSISINLLLVVFVIVCLLMSLLILMQRPKQEGLGAAFGGGVTDQVFGARTTNVLQKGTVYLGSLFFILALTLAILIGKQNETKSLLSDKAPAAEETISEEEPSGEDEVVVTEEPVVVEDDGIEVPAETAPEVPVETTPEVPVEVAPEAPVEVAPEAEVPAGETDADKSE